MTSPPFDTAGRAKPRIVAVLVFCLAAAVLAAAAGMAWVTGVRETDTMLENVPAQRAFAAVQQRAGPEIKVQILEITPREMTVWAIGPAASSWIEDLRARLHLGRDDSVPDMHEQSWCVSHWTLFSGWTEWYRVSGPTQEGNTQNEHGPSFALRPEDISDLPDLAQVAMQRADLDGTGTVAGLALDAQHWTVRLSSQRGTVNVVFARGVRERADDARTRQDFAEAIRWDREAANQGDAEAQFNIGIAHSKGEGVVRDDAEALRWYRMAAVQGLPQAQNLVAVAYAAGNGVAQSDAEALRWYRMAADQGYSPAQLHLGTMYANGRGVTRDYTEALHWYRLAADQGEAAAQYDVGLIYANGLGVPSDLAEARRWMEKAAAGDSGARQWLKDN